MQVQTVLCNCCVSLVTHTHTHTHTQHVKEKSHLPAEQVRGNVGDVLLDLVEDALGNEHRVVDAVEDGEEHGVAKLLLGDLEKQG